MNSNRKEIQPEENTTPVAQPFQTCPKVIDEIILSYLDTYDLSTYLATETKSLQLQFFVKKPSINIKPKVEAALKANLIDCAQKLLEHKVIDALPEKEEHDVWTTGSYIGLYHALAPKVENAVEKLCSYDESKLRIIEKTMSDVVFHFCQNRPREAGARLHSTLELSKPLIVLYLIRYGADLTAGGKVVSFRDSTPTLYPVCDHNSVNRAHYSSLFLALHSNYPTECVQSMLDHGAPLALLFLHGKAVAGSHIHHALLFIAAMKCSEKTVQIILKLVKDDVANSVHAVLNRSINGEFWNQRFGIEANNVNQASFLTAKLTLMDAKESLSQKQYPLTDDDVETFLQATNTSLYNLNSVDECLLCYDKLHQPTNSILHPLIWGSSKYADTSAAKEFKEPADAPYTLFRITIISTLQRAILRLNSADTAQSVDELLNTYDKVMAHPLYDREHARKVNTVHAKTTEHWQEATLTFLMKLPETEAIDNLSQYHEICSWVLRHALFSENQQGVNAKFRKQLEERIAETEEFVPECKATAMGLRA